MIRNFTGIEQLSKAAAAYIIHTVASAVELKGFAAIVLSGGSTPRLTYETLSKPETAGKQLWQKCHIFWGDERWVPANHPESNFAMADRAMLAKIRIPARNIHRIKTEYHSPEKAAIEYEKHLKNFFRAPKPAQKTRSAPERTMPLFDLVLLGMGSDGHTASLFPGTPLLPDKKKWVAAVPAGIGNPPAARITLTPALLNQAKNSLFLIGGSEKRKILAEILSHPEKTKKKYPAAWIKPAGKLIWLVAEK